MNFKERGVTIGDLVLLIIFILIISFLSTKFKNNKKQNALINGLEPHALMIYNS